MHMTPLNIYASDEAAFEDQCIKILPKIIQTQFPEKDFYCFIFKEKLINYHYGNMEPDIMIVAKDYSYWAIVEVETVDLKSLSGPPLHTYEQLEKMSATEVSRQYEIFNVINSKNPSLKLNKNKFMKMQKDIPPDLICICNKFIDEWQNAIRPLGIWLVSATEYRPSGDPNDRGNYLFHVELGDYRVSREKFRVNWLHFYFVVSDGGFVKHFEDGKFYEIDIKNYTINFMATINDQKLKLKPKSGSFSSLLSDEEKNNITTLVVKTNGFELK